MTPLEQVAAAIEEHGSPNWVAYVPMNIVRQVPYELLVELLANAKKVRMNDKNRLMLNHALANADTTITTTEAAAIMQASIPTARKFLADNPALFSSTGRGKWVIKKKETK